MSGDIKSNDRLEKDMRLAPIRSHACASQPLRWGSATLHADNVFLSGIL
jgi:hypothetical protein